MSDKVDTSAEAVERDVLALGNLAHHLTRFDSGSGDAALMLRVAATMRRLRNERDEARADAARYLADANKGAVTLLRPDIAAILRGDAVAVPVELPEEMFIHLEPGAHFLVASAWASALAASPYAPKESKDE